MGIVTVITLNLIKTRITLYADCIERKTWFGKEVMRLSDIKGLRVEGLFKVSSLKHKEIAAFSFALPKGIEKDAAWDA